MKNTAAFDELSAENKKLREVIQAQTIELERKNRELEIEAALERVRAKAMAMHHTSELQEVIHTVHEELLKLNISICGGSFIVINDDIDTELLCWGAGGTANTSELVQVPHFGMPFCTNLIKGIKKGPGFFTEEFTQQEKKEYFTELFKHHPWSELDDNQQKETLDSEGGYTRSCCVAKHTSIFIINQFGRTFSDEENDILKCFSKVFDQTYTRFLDLQTAEAQAREAQIEAALERVRARAIAMRQSDELSEAAELLYHEFLKMGVESFSCGYLINDDEKGEWKIWLTNPGEPFFKEFWTAPYEADHNLKARYESWKRKEEFHCAVLEGEENRAHHVVISKYAPWKEAMLDSLPPRLVFNSANFSLGHLLVISPDRLAPELEQAMVRFAKVFDLTWRRFLDLQKAEARAREAQIEAALERVRAQSMMMQHSDELNITSNVFHEQLLLLGLPSEFSYVWLPEEANGTHMFWATWSEKANGAVTSRSKAITYPLDKTEPYTAACFEMWESDEDVFVNRIQPEEVVGFFSTWSELVGEAENLKAQNFPDGLYYAEAYMKYGCFGINIRRPLDEAEQEVLRRFANEFERTYTRFLDLQKAEEQARKIKLVNQENERLLHSILPQPIAEQIRSGQPNVVKRFEEVSILFADIVGFTVLSEKIKPGKVVDILNSLFSKFDDLTDQYGLEKIKTIGDAYMVAAGVPEENADHAMTLFRFAQDMLLSLEEFNQSNNSQMKLRIGISSGPVVAGVIGKKKFAYDLWGDSVNTAARMEAYGQEGKIQVSPTSYELLKNNFAFEKIPGVNIKGKGVMDVYLWEPQPLFGAT